MRRMLNLAGVILGLFLSICVVRGQTSAREAGYLYLSPVPNAPYTSPQTRFVLVRFENVTPAQVSNLASGFITVTGASSGVHTGSTRVASDGRTVLFEMTDDFSQSELVTVTLNPELVAGTTGVLEPFEFRFMINGLVPGTAPVAEAIVSETKKDRERTPLSKATTPGKASPREQPDGPVTLQSAGSAVIMPNGVSVPSDFPHVTITVNDNPGPGYLFLGREATPRYTVILDNDGSPVWYRAGRGWDFKRQRNGMLTMLAPGTTTYQAYYFIGYDENFNQMATFDAVNGYNTDGHEIQLLEDGGCLLVGIRGSTVDMRQYASGGRASATVMESVIQEFTPEGDLIFQWRSWDNFDIRLLAYWAVDDQPTGGYIRFAHMNAIDVDTDGHLLLSSKHVGEVTKIDRDSGEVIWRLGSGNPDDPQDDAYLHERLDILNDPLGGFDVQHDIRAVGENRYTLFDNHYVDLQPNSRAVEYEVDPVNRTATMVWQYREDPPWGSFHMGSSQRLANGNTLINWVLEKAPKVAEVRPDGTKVFEMNWEAEDSRAYRTFRFPWNGVVDVPYLIVEPDGDNVTLIFNKFGDHSVDHYRIYGGTTPAPTTLVGTSETTLERLTNVVNGVVNYFRVTAVSTSGLESDYSNQASLLVNITVPGGNMVLNGGFTQGTNGWNWTVTPPASSQLNVAAGTAHFQISSGGSYITDVQLRQVGMALAQGKEYTLSFDAWSAAPRVFEAKVEQNAANGDNYSGIQPFNLIPTPQTHSFTFRMNSPSDNNARLVFNGGVQPHDVFIDNVSLTEHVYAPGDFNGDGCVGFDDLRILTAQWKDDQESPTADLNRDGGVDFKDFVILSENWSGDGFCP